MTDTIDYLTESSKAVFPEHKKLFEAIHAELNPHKRKELLDKDFWGHKRGSAGIASMTYENTLKHVDPRIDSLKKKLSAKGKSFADLSDEEKSDIKLHGLEALIHNNISQLGTEKAQEWKEHYETLRGKKDSKGNFSYKGFANNQEREVVLLNMAKDVFGWDINKDEAIAEALQTYTSALVNGDEAKYRAALRDIRTHAEENLPKKHINDVIDKIDGNPLLATKADIYFGKKILDKHKKAPQDLQTHFQLGWKGHAQNFYQLEEGGKLSAKMGYVPIDKKAANDKTYRKAA